MAVSISPERENAVGATLAAYHAAVAGMGAVDVRAVAFELWEFFDGESDDPQDDEDEDEDDEDTAELAAGGYVPSPPSAAKT